MGPNFSLLDVLDVHHRNEKEKKKPTLLYTIAASFGIDKFVSLHVRDVVLVNNLSVELKFDMAGPTCLRVILSNMVSEIYSKF